MSEVELKPCPFCGGTAEFERRGSQRQSCIVACEDCGGRLESNESDWNSGSAWNRRAEASTLAAEVERLKGEAEEARANLLLQTICRLPSVLTTDDWQAYLDEHREEWLNDDRAFGGWVSRRLSVALATARADAERWRVVRVGGRVNVTEPYIEGAGGQRITTGLVADSYADEYADMLIAATRGEG